MADEATTVASLREAVRRFAEEREWQPFHSPKNLAMGLAVETAELMEHCHLFNLCNSLDIDLSDAVGAKISKNALKYPVEKYRGKFEIKE